MAHHRVSRVREQLQRELGDIVRRLRDPRIGFVTVMDVELSRDLRDATMFVSVVGDAEQQNQAVAALERAMGHVRSEVASRMRLRHTPEITVRYDATSERAARVSALIDSLPAVSEVPPDDDPASSNEGDQ